MAHSVVREWETWVDVLEEISEMSESASSQG